MPVDLVKIREKIAELNGQRKQSNVQMWKPGPGEYKIRILPWKNLKEGEVFKELWFYYLGKERGILAPNQFGKPDPINELMRKLYGTGKADDKLIANKLRAKMRSYAPIIVRGEESKGVQVWSFGKIVHARLLSFFIDEEIGDITDPNTGFDLKITVSQQAGKEFQDTVVDPARRPSKLSEDANHAKQWLENLPDVDGMWPQKTAQEVETTLNNWLSGGAVSAEDKASDGSTRGTAKGNDALDDLVNDVKSDVKASAPKAEAKLDEAPKTTKKAKSKSVDETADVSAKSKDLDAAFAELMEGE